MALDTHNTLGYSVLLLNCHQSTHLSACCYWTVTRVHTFQRVVIELTPEYTPFSVLLLNCHQSTHLSTCCCDFLDLISHRSRTHRAQSLHEYDLKGPITTQVWPPCPNHYISMTSKSQSPGRYNLQVQSIISMITKEVWLSGPNQLQMTMTWALKATEIWPCGSNQIQKHDLQGPISYRWLYELVPRSDRSMTLWIQPDTEVWPCGPSQLQRYDLVGPISYRAKPATELWPRPCQLQKYDLVGPTSYRIMTWAQPVREVWLSEPSLLQKNGSHSLHYVGDSFHLIESPSCT